VSERALTRDEASRVLGVPVSADPSRVKRAYRRLVQEHHPDHGGDPGTFQRLQEAYERLLTDPVDPRTLMARGRPSRPPVPFTDETATADLGSVRWDAVAPAEGDRLSRDAVAVWLVGEDGALRDLTAVSRSPGSRLNGMAGQLAAELTSWLRIERRRDDRGVEQIVVELTASNRRARRRLDAAALEGTWVRTRRSSSTSLRTTLRLSADPRSSSVRAVDRTEALLTQLDWPLTAWVLTADAGAA
jgi:hypothetical protein